MPSSPVRNLGDGPESSCLDELEQLGRRDVRRARSAGRARAAPGCRRGEHEPWRTTSPWSCGEIAAAAEVETPGQPCRRDGVAELARRGPRRGSPPAGGGACARARATRGAAWYFVDHGARPVELARLLLDLVGVAAHPDEPVVERRLGALPHPGALGALVEDEEAEVDPDGRVVARVGEAASSTRRPSENTPGPGERTGPSSRGRSGDGEQELERLLDELADLLARRRRCPGARAPTPRRPWTGSCSPASRSSRAGSGGAGLRAPR